LLIAAIQQVSDGIGTAAGHTEVSSAKTSASRAGVIWIIFCDPWLQECQGQNIAPFNGRFTIGRAVTDWPSVGFTVSTLLPAPLTSTVSDRAPTEQVQVYPFLLVI